MATRVVVCFVAAGWFAGLLGGCVSADVYRVKEREVQALHRANEDMQERNRSLTAEKTELTIRSGEMKKENEGLRDLIAKQNEDIVYLQNRVEKLEQDGEGLRDRVENLKAEIAELNQENRRLAALSSPENLLRSLAERLGDLQRQVEALSGENEKLKNNQVIARSEEGTTGGAEGEKTIKPADEAPQAVLVSAGQETEDGKQDPQPREEGEASAIPNDPAKPSDKP